MAKIPDGLFDLTEQYHINRHKAWFPVNTLRLFYLMLARDLTHNNKEAIDKVNTVIPKISGYLDLGERALRSEECDVKALKDATASGKQALLEIIDTPNLRHFLDITWEQNLVFAKQNRHEQLVAAKDDPNYSLGDLLAPQGMDAVLYARINGAIIAQFRHAAPTTPTWPFQDREEVLEEVITCVMQLNHIADAICYAKEDMQTSSDGVIQWVLNRTDTVADAIEMLTNALHTRQEALKHMSLSEPARQHVYQFSLLLEAVVNGEKPGHDPSP
jgi:hypothetical protein